MPRIWVCREDDLALVAESTGAETLFQFNSPSRVSQVQPSGINTVERFAFHDITSPQDGLISVTRDDIERLIRRSKTWDRQTDIICQCWMGVSRSTAASLIVWASLGTKSSAPEIAGRLRQAAPFATPNQMMIALADDALGFNGSLLSAVRAIGRGAETSFGTPFFLEPFGETP